MKRVRQREEDARGLDRAALVRPGEIVGLSSVLLQPVLQLDQRDDRKRAEPLGELYRRADVVTVTVRHRDHVATLGLLFRVRALRVLEPWVHVDALAARRVEAERGVSEP